MRTQNLKDAAEALAYAWALFVLVFVVPCACVAIEAAVKRMGG